MRAKLTGIPSQTRALLFALVLFFPSILDAQEINFQDSIDSTAEALILLDVKASDCLSALDAGADSHQLCVDFMAAIDGELMADYLDQCRELKDWRDDYVDQTIVSDIDAGNPGNEEMLRRLIAIEYSCGENTVIERTEFVAAAFNRLRSNTAPTTTATDAAAIRRQLSERRFNALEASERQRLLDALQNQQNRSEREIERQFNDLENELLRQQIRNSNRPVD